jgi:hypothetical protein
MMTWATFVISLPLPVAAATALQAAGVPPEQVRRAALRIGSLLTAWIAVAFALGSLDIDGMIGIPAAKAPIALAVAAVFAAVLYLTNRRVFEAVPQSWLIGVQTFRGLGAIFLVLYGFGKLPGTFALPAGFGDWTVGLLAIPVALLYAYRRSTGVAVAWNVLGMLDLITAVTMGVLNTRGLNILPPDTSNQLLAVLPLSMIPFYLVPLSFMLHIASLVKLSREREPGSVPAAA